MTELQTTTLSSNKPDCATLAVTFYNAARAEVLQRLNMRETTFLAWITVVGAILSFSAKNTSDLFDPRYLQLIAPLSLPFSLAIYRHSLLIAYLGQYLRQELDPHLLQLENLKEQEIQKSPRHWDISKTMSTRIRWFLAIEGGAYTFFLAGIPLLCLIHLHVGTHLSWRSPWMWGGGLCTVLAGSAGTFQVVRLLWYAPDHWYKSRIRKRSTNV